MTDLEGRDFVKNDWVRGICRYGIMPCNGMIYSTPTPCSCYPAALLTGFNALAADKTVDDERRETKRLEKGAAFGEPTAGKVAGPADWPRFRHSRSRSGTATTEVNTNFSEDWKTELSGELSQPTVADGKLFVASGDKQTVHALSAETGKELWSYTVDGRVDSPPTYDKGRLLFDSRSGWVYSLRATDGLLIWRYRVAPSDDQIVSYNQLESVWPARGSALVVDDVVYAAAGRNSYLDDGIVVVGLDAATGHELYHAHLKNEPQDPATDKGDPHIMDGFRLDVLSFDGTYIYMQGATFDKTLQRVSNEVRQKPGIYASAGFLDDYAWNRNAWRCGTDVDSLRLNKRNLAGMPRTWDGEKPGLAPSAVVAGFVPAGVPLQSVGEQFAVGRKRRFRRGVQSALAWMK